jgi:dTDP-4-dehydrorhamnose 3,5-epimerase
MKFLPTDLPGVLIVEPKVHGDERGFFLETYHEQRNRAGGITLPFVQDNHSRSLGPILRGLHTQRLRPQGKLVRCIEGRIFDVAADIRLGSPTFGKWVGAELSASNFRQLWVPPEFLHGFCVLDSPAQVEYKCTDFYDPTDELGVIWNDPDLGITWPISDPILSQKDRALSRLGEVQDLLPRWRGAAQ